MIDTLLHNDLQTAGFAKLAANTRIVALHPLVHINIAPGFLGNRRRQIRPVILVGLHQMAPDAFLIENRTFIAFFVHFERCIDEERHTVAGV
ncbi:hypothetical protein D3C73_1164360 [compost metagenome]